MKKIFIGLSALILISLVACKKDALSNLQSQTESDIYDQNDDPDELIYNEPFELEERASNPLRINTVVSLDSLPIFQSGQTVKRQKYYRRHVVSTTDETRFIIKGVGFGSEDGTSNVECFIKGIEQDEPQIISWSDTLIVVDIEPLDYVPAISKTFSIKFKVWRDNPVTGKVDFSRSRSKSCISDQQAKTVYSVQVAAKAFLEGALDTINGLMSDVLRVNNVIPNKEPFDFFIGNEKDSVLASVFTVTGNDAITDWILLEAQTETGIIVCQKACLIQRDGDIVDLDGVTSPSLRITTGLKYQIVVRHRNHRFIKQKTPVKYLATGAVLNFTQDSTITILTKKKGSYRTMFLGDLNNDGILINTDDYNIWLGQRFQQGYKKADVNFSKDVNAVDYNLMFLNKDK